MQPEGESASASEEPSRSISYARPESSEPSTESAPVSKKVRRKPVFKSKAAPEQTVVTPRVYDLCKDLFPENEFKVVGENTQERIVLTDEEKQEYPIHEGDPDTIEWVLESRTVPRHYKSVIMDGTQYNVRILQSSFLLYLLRTNTLQVGDTVMVLAGEDENINRAKMGITSSNPYASTMW